ncbi:hypothetical protein ACXJJ3_18120 [Kribbella sp. WER1]
MTVTQLPQPTDRRVRVWFGEHVIADYTAESAKAIQYHVCMTRRFASLRITIESLPAAVDEDAADL